MSFEAVSHELRLGEFDATFSDRWKLSERSFPEGGLFFVEREFLDRYGRLVRLHEAALQGLFEASELVQARPALALLLWHEYRLLSGVTSAHGPRCRRARKESTVAEVEPAGFPDLREGLGGSSWSINLLLALSLLPDMIWFYRQRAIPDSVFEETVEDFPLWCSYFHRHFGVQGISLAILQWLSNHLHGRLFKLGRLQFMRGEFAQAITVYRKAGSAELCVLAPPEMAVQADGLYPPHPFEVPGLHRSLQDSIAWTTRRAADERLIAGHPLLEGGRVAGASVELSVDEWSSVLERGDGVLEMHIPEGAPLEIARCARAVRRAGEFFTEYFPERTYCALTCESWFLDPAFDELLPPGSNIRQFAHGLHRYPIEGPEEESLSRIYGPAVMERGIEIDPSSSSLQRACADYLSRGGSLRPGGGFLLKGEAPWA